MNFEHGTLTLECGGEKIMFNLYGTMYAPTRAYQVEILDNYEFDEILHEFTETLKRRDEYELLLSDFEQDLFFGEDQSLDADKEPSQDVELKVDIVQIKVEKPVQILRRRIPVMAVEEVEKLQNFQVCLGAMTRSLQLLP